MVAGTPRSGAGGESIVDIAVARKATFFDDDEKAAAALSNSMRFRGRSGLSLGYATRGAGPVIAFLHPVAMRGALWDEIASDLAQRYRVLTIDLRGHGASDVPPEPFTIEDLASDVIELLGALGGTRPVLAGCSLGGMVAQGVALAAPELLGGIVLADTAHTLPAAGREAMRQRAADALKGMPTLVDATLERWFTREFRARRGDIVERVRGWFLEADPVVHSWTWQAISRLDFRDRLAAIQVPVLVVCGSRDTSCPPSVSEEMAGLLARGRYAELQDSSHMAPFEQPGRFAALVDEFVPSARGT
jgi:3-oxoadipate enol-lactonase